MKKLFAVKDRKTKKIIDYFEDKMKAKEARNKLNPPRDKDFILGTQERYYVTPGPDHKHYNKN